MNKQLKKFIVVIVILFALMFAYILNISGIFEKLEQGTVNFKISLKTSDAIPDNIIRLYPDNIYKDDTEGLNEGFSRNDLRQLIEFLEKQSPALILLNVDLNSYEDTSLESASSDIKLAKTLKKYDNIILSTHLTKEIQSDNDYSLSNLLLSKAIADVDTSGQKIKNDIPYYGNDKFPIVFAQGEYVTASNIFSTNNKIVEAKPLYKIVKQDKNYYIPSMAFYAFLRLTQLDKKKIVIKNNNLLVGDTKFSLNKNGNIFLNLKKKGKYFHYYPISALTDSLKQRKKTFLINNEEVNFEVLKNKIIILEETSENTSIKQLANNDSYTNGEIIALELDNYLQAYKQKYRTFAINAIPFINVLLTLIICVFILVLRFRYKSKYGGVFLILFYLLFVLFSFLTEKVLFETVRPLYFMIITEIFSYLLNYFEKIKQKDIIISLFRQHVSKEVLSKLAKNYDKISIKPQKKFITALHCEIVNFKELVDKVSPDELINRLNEVLDIIVTLSLKNKGTVNKINSNSVISYWGAPISLENFSIDSCNAIKTAIEIRKKVANLNLKYKNKGEFLPDLKITLHSGESVIGFVSTTSFGSYSAFGNTIDTLNKILKISCQFEKDILISHSTYELLKNLKNCSISDSSVEFGYAGAVNTQMGKLLLYEIKEVPLAYQNTKE